MEADSSLISSLNYSYTLKMNKMYSLKYADCFNDKRKGDVFLDFLTSSMEFLWENCMKLCFLFKAE